jgi:hypothetical protein
MAAQTPALMVHKRNRAPARHGTQRFAEYAGVGLAGKQDRGHEKKGACRGSVRLGPNGPPGSGNGESVLSVLGATS